MRKSNWLIAGVLAVACGFFLWLWYYLGLNLVDQPKDLVFAIIWWVVIAAVCIAIHKAEQKRQERIRTTFIGRDVMFNPEFGLVGVQSREHTMETLENVLANLTYGFDMAEFPEKDNPRLDYVVRTKKYEAPEETEDAEQDAEGAQAMQATETAGAHAQQAQQQEAEPVWEGEVAFVQYPDDDPKPFSSREELARILGLPVKAPTPTTSAPAVAAA